MLPAGLYPDEKSWNLHITQMQRKDLQNTQIHVYDAMGCQVTTFSSAKEDAAATAVPGRGSLSASETLP